MEQQIKNVKYPENLYLRLEVFKSGRQYKEIAITIGVNRMLLSRTVNGHYKGTNIVPLLQKELGLI